MIQKLIVVAGLILNLNSFAGDIDGVCGLNSCTPKMLEILKEYQAGEAKDFFPAVMSGECFHRSRLYNPNHAHYGGVLVDAYEGDLYFGGRFHFFAPDNPYRHLDVDTAREHFAIKYKDVNKVSKKDAGWFTDLNPGQIPLIRYYFSQKDGITNMIGVWGVEHIMFCQLVEH